MIGMSANLQNEKKEAHGRLLTHVQHAVETSRTDGLRAEVVSYMMNHYNEYKNLDLAVVNSNMPDQFTSIDERIIAMTDPQSLPGDIDIVLHQAKSHRKK